MKKRTAGGLVVFVALVALCLPAFSQENALDWASPRTMSLGMATAGSDAPSGDSINPASSAGIQRYTLDLNIFGLFGTSTEPGVGVWVNAGGVIPTAVGNFGITGHFGYSPFPSIPFGTLGGVNLSFSKDLLPDLDFGIGLGFQIGAVPADATTPQANMTTDWGLGLDLGFIHKIDSLGFIKDFRWGVALRGLGKGFGYTGPYGAMPAPFTPAIGTQFKLIKTDDVVWTFNLDLAAPSVQNLQVTPGFDLKLFQLFALQISYDFDLVQTLNRYLPSGHNPNTAITKASSRVFPLNFGVSVFSAGFKTPEPGNNAGSDAVDASKPVPFYQNSEFNPSAVFAPLNNGVLVFGLGLNMPIGVIDTKPPVLEIGEPVFEDSPAESVPAPAAPATSTSSASVTFELPFGADTVAPVTGSGASPAPASSPVAPGIAAPVPSPVAAPVIDPARASGLATGNPVYISPNFDGIRDALTLPLNLKDDRPIASFSLYITDFQGKVVRTIRNKEERPETVDIGQLFTRLFRLKTGLPVPKNLVWDGRSDAGMVVPDGVYAYQVEAADDNNNSVRTSLRPVIVDTRSPVLEADSNAPSFAPGGDRPVLVFGLQSGETLAPVDSWSASVLAKDGKAVRTWTWKDKLPANTIWDGKTDQGVLAPDGIYSFHLATADRAGNKAIADVDNLLLLNKPTPVGLTIDNAYFSPNADSIKDTVLVSIDANDQVKVTTWSAKLLNGKGTAVRTVSGTDALPKSMVMDGKDDSGKALPEDVYKLSLTALYENGNNPTSLSPSMTLDLTKPSIKVNAEYPVFSPNGDGFKDSLLLHQLVSTESPVAAPVPVWDAQILAADGKKARFFTWRTKPDDALIWDGRDSANNVIADGSYTYQITATDLAGNVVISNPVVIKVDNRPTSVAIRSARPAFAPATDSQFKTMGLNLEEKLTDGIASWSVRILPAGDNAKAATAVAGFNGKGTPPDALSWDGKKSDKSMAPDGPYLAELTVIYDKGDQPQSWTPPFTVKNRRPEVKLTTDNLFFSPDGDGKQDAITFNQTTTTEESWTGTISDSKDRIIKTVSWPGSAALQYVWDGTDNNGNKAPDGDYKYFLATTDSAGNQASAQLTPVKLQTIKPELSLSVGSTAFSPKAGSARVTMELRPVLKLNSDNDIKDWKLQINPASGGNARNITGSGKVPETLLWDGKTDGGRVAPEGDYQAILTVNYKSGQAPNAQSPRFALDITAPVATVFADPVLFSPDSDTQKDSTTINQELSKEANWKATISFATPPSATADPVVRTFTWSGTAPKTVSWDGTNAQGIVVPDGRYLYQIEATDAAGNSGKSAPTEIRIDNRATPITIKADKRWFSPVIDAKNRQTLTPTILMAEGIESWQLEIRNASNALIKTFKGTNNPPASLEWDGKTDAGAMSPDGDYLAGFTVTYLKGNKPTVKTDVFTMDTKAPEIKLAADDLIFSPDPESRKQVAKIGQVSSVEDLWEGSVQALDGKVIKSYFWKGQAQDFAWDGRDENGNLQKDGAYKYVVSSTDKAGNTTRQELKGLTIDTRATPVLLIADAKGFAPGTGRAAVSTINFKPMLTLTDGVSGWTLRMLNNSAQGKVERTITGTGLPPASLSWDGLNDNKVRAPEGKYEASLTVEYKKGNMPDARTNPFVLDVSAPKAQVTGAPQPFSPDDDGIDDEVTISIAVEDLSPIKDWTLEILDPQGTHFVTFSGSGTPTSRIIWNGHSDTGELVQAALDYTAVLAVTDNLGNKGSYKEAIPVDVLVLRDGNDLRIRIPGITFPSNSPDLNSKDLKPDQLAQNAKTLDRLAEILRKYGSYQIVVEGHANITQYWSAAEAEKENRTELQPLSEKRAQAVKDALAKRGIAASRLSTVGVGGVKPVVANNDLANVWKNRRVEFILRK